MEKNPIPSFRWDDKTEETKVPEMDDLATNVANIRNALKNRPTQKGYLALIGELLDRGLLDEANQAADEYKKWMRSEKKSNK